MAHYAFLNENNTVVEVIVGIDENKFIEGLDPEIWYGNFRNQICKRTSYNNNYRKNFAGIGYTYDSERDAFIPPKVYLKWILNEETCKWESPIPYPDDQQEYIWNDNQGVWEIMEGIE